MPLITRSQLTSLALPDHRFRRSRLLGIFSQSNPQSSLAEQPPVLHEALTSPPSPRISLQGAAPASLATSSTEPEEKRPELFDQSSRSSAKEAGVRFAKRKAACVVPDSFAITMATHQNDQNAATGLLQIAFKGRGKTRYPHGTQELFAFGKRQRNADGQVCDCDCMIYRQYIRAIAAQRLPGQSTFQPIGQMKSGHRIIPVDQQWHHEDISTIPGYSTHGCERDFEDHPGFDNGTKTGVGVLLRYNFLLQIWDICKQKSVKESHQTLTIAGDTPPRLIRWTPGLKPLNIDDISSLETTSG